MRKELYPLSKTEEEIYIACLKETDAYNLANVMKLGKDIDVAKFREAVEKVFEAHPYLFTVLSMGDDGRVYKRIVIKKTEIPITKHEKPEWKSLPFKMLGEHLFRLELQECKGEYYFLYDFHHIIHQTHLI